MTVQFEEDAELGRSTFQTTSSGEGWLVSWGLAKTKTQSNIIMTVILAIILIASFFMIKNLFGSNGAKLKAPQGNTIIKVNGVPPKLQNPIR